MSGSETCDDCTNDGGYGECASGYLLGPHCNDRGFQPDSEECDEGNSTNRDGRSGACKIEVIVTR